MNKTFKYINPLPYHREKYSLNTHWLRRTGETLWDKSQPLSGPVCITAERFYFTIKSFKMYIEYILDPAPITHLLNHNIYIPSHYIPSRKSNLNTNRNETAEICRSPLTAQDTRHISALGNTRPALPSSA